MFTEQQKRQLKNNKIEWYFNPDDTIEFRYGVDVVCLTPAQIMTKVHQMGWFNFIAWVQRGF